MTSQYNRHIHIMPAPRLPLEPIENPRKIDFYIAGFDPTHKK